MILSWYVYVGALYVANCSLPSIQTGFPENCASSIWITTLQTAKRTWTALCGICCPVYSSPSAQASPSAHWAEGDGGPFYTIGPQSPAWLGLVPHYSWQNSWSQWSALTLQALYLGLYMVIPTNWATIEMQKNVQVRNSVPASLNSTKGNIPAWLPGQAPCRAGQGRAVQKCQPGRPATASGYWQDSDCKS